MIERLYLSLTALSNLDAIYLLCDYETCGDETCDHLPQ
jgi:hypothetical protein